MLGRVAELEICGDCKVALPPVAGSGHAYLGASPSCWALYGDLLSREYSDPRYMKVHRLSVDAYAAQHPGRPERRTIQSIWVHLAGLYLTLEGGATGEFATRVMASLTKDADTFYWLEPPAAWGSTVAAAIEARDAAMHEQLVRRWAADVWEAWRGHHAAIRALVDAHLSES